MIANYLLAADDYRLLWKTYIHFHEIMEGRETFYHSRFSLKTIKATSSEDGERRMGVRGEEEERKSNKILIISYHDQYRELDLGESVCVCVSGYVLGI
jgi:hypothetical protein